MFWRMEQEDDSGEFDWLSFILYEPKLTAQSHQPFHPSVIPATRKHKTAATGHH